MEGEGGSRLAEVVKGTCGLTDVTADDHSRPIMATTPHYRGVASATIRP